MSQRTEDIVETDHWRFHWTAQALTITALDGSPCQHEYEIKGDPHFYMDGELTFDFPDANCTFVFTDGTVLVAQAPEHNQPMRDCHIFTPEKKHFPLGDAGKFDEECGCLFIQASTTCEFYCTSPTAIGANNRPATVPPEYEEC